MDLRTEINRHLYSLSLELDPTDDADENRRRHDILVDAGQQALDAAESPDGEPSAPRKRAILAAMMSYGRARLAGQPAEFRVERSSNGKFPGVPPWMIAMVQQVTQDHISAAWDETPSPEITSHFVSKKGRYDERQKAGTQRRFETERKRIAVIQATARTMASEGPGLLPDYEVSEQTARRWIRRYKKPSLVAEAMIEHYINAIASAQDSIIERYNNTVEQRFPEGADERKITPPKKSALKAKITRRWVKSTAQRGREKLVHLRRQDEGLKRRENKRRISQALSEPPEDDPSSE